MGLVSESTGHVRWSHSHGGRSLLEPVLPEDLGKPLMVAV